MLNMIHQTHAAHSPNSLSREPKFLVWWVNRIAFMSWVDELWMDVSIAIYPMALLLQGTVLTSHPVFLTYQISLTATDHVHSIYIPGWESAMHAHNCGDCMYQWPVRGQNWPTASNFCNCRLAACAIPIHTCLWIFATAFALAGLRKSSPLKVHF